MAVVIAARAAAAEAVTHTARRCCMPPPWCAVARARWGWHKEIFWPCGRRVRARGAARPTHTTARLVGCLDAFARASGRLTCGSQKMLQHFRQTLPAAAAGVAVGVAAMHWQNATRLQATGSPLVGVYELHSVWSRQDNHSERFSSDGSILEISERSSRPVSGLLVYQANGRVWTQCSEKSIDGGRPSFRGYSVRHSPSIPRPLVLLHS